MSATQAQVADAVRGHADALRDAYKRAAGLGADERRRVLRTVLQYQFRALAPNVANTVLRQLRLEFSDAPSAPAEVERAPPAISADLRRLLQSILGDRAVSDSVNEANALRDATIQLQESIHVLRAVLRKPDFSLDELLRRAARDLSTHGTAMEHAARESFDRVLSALDPAEAMKAVPKKTLSTDAMHKAALFDAIKEKHQQLQLYHSRGRLVRDYKSAYKKYIQDESSR